MFIGCSLGLDFLLSGHVPLLINLLAQFYLA